MQHSATNLNRIATDVCDVRNAPIRIVFVVNSPTSYSFALLSLSRNNVCFFSRFPRTQNTLGRRLLGRIWHDPPLIGNQAVLECELNGMDRIDFRGARFMAWADLLELAVSFGFRDDGSVAMKSTLFRGVHRQLMTWGMALIVGCPVGLTFVDGQQVESSVASPNLQEKPEDVTGRSELEKLKWLVGKWKTSSDAPIPAEASAQWSPDGHFLILDYRVSPPGFPVISASDRIAWDPSAKSFRSWTFRGDGGFGQANWVGREQGWMIRYGGIHRDGRQLSSTLLLVQGAEGKLELSAIERWIGDEQFPDLLLQLSPEQPPAAAVVSIENKTWELTRLESGPCRAKNRPTLAMNDQEVQAFGGINQIGGEYQRTGETLRFRNLESTLMGGSESDSEIEQEFSSMLERVTRYTLEDNQLILWAEDKQIAWFVERPSAPTSFDQVRDITWALIELKGAPIDADSRPTLRFGEGNVEGYGGVNQMGGTFNQTETALSFGPLRATRRGGSQAAMQLEARFGQVLETVDRFDLDQDQLLLLSGNEVVAKFRRQE